MRKSISKKIIALLLLFSCLLLFAGCSKSKNVELTLTIDGEEFNFKSKVQDLYDAGFVICNTAYGEITSESDLPELEARVVDTISSYYVGRPNSSSYADFTGVVIQVYNPSSKACSFKEASIYCYTYQYDPTEESTIQVLFNDVNFAGLNHEEGLEAMEGLGITFGDKDREEFLDASTNQGFGWPLLTSSSKYSYHLSRERAAEGSLYIDEVYFKKQLDIDYTK